MTQIRWWWAAQPSALHLFVQCCAGCLFGGFIAVAMLAVRELVL